MTPLAELAAFAGVMALGQFSPGPDMVLLTRTALSEGWASGVKTAAGIATGLAVLSIATVGGLSAAFRSDGVWGKALTLAGAAYLCWLALNLIRTAGTMPEPGRKRTIGAAYLRGLLCNLLNPKALLFLAAVTSPFLAGDHDHWWPWAIGGVIVIQGFVLWSAWVFVLQRAVVRETYRRWAKWIDRLFALALFALAVTLILGYSR